MECHPLQTKHWHINCRKETSSSTSRCDQTPPKSVKGIAGWERPCFCGSSHSKTSIWSLWRPLRECFEGKPLRKKHPLLGLFSPKKKGSVVASRLGQGSLERLREGQPACHAEVGRAPKGPDVIHQTDASKSPRMIFKLKKVNITLKTGEPHSRKSQQLPSCLARRQRRPGAIQT